jgi:hypothetical protein
MPLKEKNRRRLGYLFFVVAAISFCSFTYLNLCAENTLMISEYVGGISYADFRIEQIVLPDLHFFENSFNRIIELLFTKV